MDTEVYDSVPFRGRTEFLNDLQKAWMHNKCVVFGVYGMKSVGKSRTARKHITDVERLVLQNNKQFREVKIVDVNLRLLKTDREIYVQMCESLEIVADIYNVCKQIESHIKKNKDKYFILLFDNFDALKDSTLKDKLKSFVAKLAVIRYNIQLYITSTENVLFTQIKALFYHKTLEPMNDIDSKELLKAAANNIVIGECLDQIVQLCAGLPLAIIMVAVELQTDDGMVKPEEIVQILTDSRLEALSRDNYRKQDRIEDVYKKFIMKLTPVFQQRLAKLQYIEGDFNAKQATEILGHKSVPSAKHHALIQLKRSNYLSYDSKTERFHINSILRDCISVYICIHRLPDVRKRFCRLFTEEMTTISRQMSAAEYVKAVAALKLEHPNLLKLMKEVFYTKEDTYSFLIEIASNCSSLLELNMRSHYEEFYEGCLKMVKQYGRHEDEAVVKIAYGNMLTNVKDDSPEGETYYLQALQILKDKPLSKMLADLYVKLGQNLRIQGRVEDSLSKAVKDTPQTQGSSLKKAKKESPKPSEKSDKVIAGNSLEQTLREGRYQVFTLEGHNDVVTAVEATDSILVTASRDTTVKVWNFSTLTEIRNLGGHTDSVTDVVILDKEQSKTVASKLGWTDAFDHIVLSGSMDCSFRLWSAKTGQQIKSVYTYNPVTKLAYHPGQDLVITVSDGGKLELWDVVTSVNIQSLRAHDDTVTALCLISNTVTTSTSSGEIKVHEICDRSLICLFESENLQSTSGRHLTPRYIRSLAATKDHIFYGDDGINIKVLNWKRGLVSKICNHAGDVGITDALWCRDKLLFASAFDLHTGYGSLNVFQVDPDLQYLITLTDEDTCRIMDVKYCQGTDCIITGGMELKVWRKLTSDQRASEENIIPNVIPRLMQQAVDSDMESDVEFSESESEADFNGGEHGDSDASQQNGGWSSWCSLL